MSFKPEDVELEIEFLEDTDSESDDSEEESDDVKEAKANGLTETPPSVKRRRALSFTSRKKNGGRPGMIIGQNLHILGMTERIFGAEKTHGIFIYLLFIYFFYFFFFFFLVWKKVKLFLFFFSEFFNFDNFWGENSTS